MIAEPIYNAFMRGAFHATTGSVIVVALLLTSKQTVSLSLALITAAYLTMELARLQIRAVNRWIFHYFAFILRRREISTLTGSSYFLLGCVITVSAFPVYIAVPAILFMALGDPAAALIGIWQGHIRFWDRSIEGHMACLITCILCGWVLAGTNDDLTMVIASVGIVTATLLQALPLPANDNLTMPVIGATAMYIASVLS